MTTLLALIGGLLALYIVRKLLRPVVIELRIGKGCVTAWVEGSTRFEVGRWVEVGPAQTLISVREQQDEQGVAVDITESSPGILEGLRGAYVTYCHYIARRRFSLPFYRSSCVHLRMDDVAPAVADSFCREARSLWEVRTVETVSP